MSRSIEPITLVIPCLNEADCLRPLLDEVFRTLGPRLAEVIVVDDGSTDDSPEILAALMQAEPRLVAVTHAASSGQSSAVRTGVRAAETEWIATLDADGQNPPDQVKALILALDALPSGHRRIGLVQGERRRRQDGSTRRWASALANRIRSATLRDGVRDSACGLKLFRRRAYLELPFFDHIHRFLPAMMRREGWDVLVVPVAHRPRIAGRSHYSNLQRALVGAVDLAGAAWLQRRRSPTAPQGRTWLHSVEEAPLRATRQLSLESTP
jgi:dolichol-phosphate mannosyltransferase